MSVHSLLRNRNVLYVVLFFSVLNLFSYLMLKQLDAVAFFIIIGFLATYFSKNMIIVLMTSVVSTFILVQINMLGRVQEGLKGLEDRVDANDEDVIKTDPTAKKDKTDISIENTMNTPGTTSAGMPTSGTALTQAQQTSLTSIKDTKGTSGAGTSGAGTSGSTSTGAGAKKEKFTQQLSPARFNASDDDDDTAPRHKPKVDYAATLESAYDNLDKLLSSDAIKNMTADTGRLAEKQQQLMGNIEKLTPIMDKASSVLSNLDMGGISGLMGGIQERLKGFSKEGAIPA